MTKNGKAILEIINSSDEHLTAEQIYQRLATDFSKMAMATVYNNLNRLYEEGAVKKIVMDGQPDRYDKVSRHDHLICSKCGRISDLYLEDLSAKLESVTGISIDSYDLKLYYRCPKCRAQN